MNMLNVNELVEVVELTHDHGLDGFRVDIGRHDVQDLLVLTSLVSFFIRVVDFIVELSGFTRWPMDTTTTFRQMLCEPKNKKAWLHWLVAPLY
jgi:hypothetical protein